MPLAPGVVSDGNFKVAAQNGAVVFEQPFAASRNDFVTFLARRNMRVQDGYYVNPVPMSQRSFGLRGTGYLVDITTPSIIEGSDILDYTEIYASLPPTQREYGTASAQIQVPYLATLGEDSRWIILNLNDTFDAEFVYEYSLNAPLPTLFRAKLMQTAFAVGYFLAGFNYNKPPVDGLYLAQNSTTTRWMGSIFCRESVFVRPPPVTKYTGLEQPAP